MVRGSDKTYGQLILKAKKQTDRQEIGETSSAFLKDLEKMVTKIAQDQADRCMEKGFHLDKYYIHLSIIKDPWSPNVLKVIPLPIRLTRPSPYQQEDHYLWSVTHLNHIQFEWCIPSREILTFILKNPSQFDPGYVNMLRKYCSDKIDKIEDYMIDGKLA